MPAPWEEDVEVAPWEAAAPVKASAPKKVKKKPVPQAKPVDNARDIVKETYPSAQITDWVRDPNSPLGRKNPDSWHNNSRAAVDTRRIPGMSFEEYVDGFRKKGYSILEARDEYTNPSAHATGPHWHTVLGGEPKPVAPVDEKAPWDVAETPKKKGPISTPVLPKDVYPYPDDIGRTPGYGTEQWDLGSGNPIPAGYNIADGLDRDGRPDVYSDQKALKHFTWWSGKNPEGKKMSDDVFLETAFKKYPHVPDTPYNRKTLLWYRSHYKVGGKNPMSFNTKEEEKPKTPPSDTSVSAPPPLDFGEIVLQSGKEMADQAGHGLNAAIIRGSMKGYMNEKDYAREVQNIEEDRAVRQRFWNDQGNRTDSPITDEIGKFVGAIGGDMNPAYLYAPVGGSAAAGRIATQAGINAGIDVGVQNAEMYQGTREGYDPSQTAMSAAMGAAFQGAVGEPLGLAISRWKSRGGEARAFEDNPRVVEVGDTPAPTAAPGTPVKVRANKKTVGDEIATLTKGWENSPEFVVHSGKKSFAKVEPDLWAKLKEDGAQKAPAFYADDGRIHVISDNVKDVARVKSIVYHEALGHSGLANKFGDDLNVVMTELYKKNWKLRQEADALRTGTQYGEIYSADANPTARYVEEVLAKRSENGVLSKSILDKFIPMLRQYGRDMGLDLRFTDREVRAILADAHNTVVNGGTTNTGGSGLRYMYTGLRGESVRNERGYYDAPETYHLAADRADSGEPAGPGSQVHKDTGWFVGPDGRWRSELSDAQAQLTNKFHELKSGEKMSLSEALDHPELFSRYPELRDMPVTKKPDLFDFFQTVQGWKDKNGLNITPYAKDKLGTTLHEVQHAVQELEGFSQGGNSNNAVGRLSPKHLAETARKVSDYYGDLATKSEVSSKAYLAAADDPLFQRLEEVQKKLKKSYDIDEPFELRVDLVREKSDLQNKLWQKHLGVKNGVEAKKLDRESYDQMWELFQATSHQDGILGKATELAQELDKIKAMKRDIDRNLNKDGTVVDKDHLVKTLQKNEDLPFEAYKHLFGEVEARDTANRINLSEKDRLETTPYTSEKDIDPTGYVFDKGMGGYGVSKSETPILNKYILPEEKKGRAGSINLDKIVTKDGIDTAKLYTAFAEGIDREKVTYSDAIAAVKEAGVTPSRLLKKKMKLDPTFGISAAVALEKGHADVIRLQKKILTGNATAKEEGNFAYLLARQAALQQKVSNYRSDIGRALNFMKIMINEKGPLPREFFDRLNVADLSNRNVLYRIAEMMDEHTGNQAAQSKIIRDQFTPFWEDYIISARYSMMLYGLGTHAKNFIGNASMGLLDSASHVTASGLGHLQGKKLRGTERVTLKGAALRNVAMAKALFEAQTWKDVGTAWLTGKPPHQVSKVEVGHNIFTEKLGVAGAAIDAPQKALAASDSMWRSILENGQLYELSLRIADREGLKGGALWDRVAELTANPTPEMAKLADSNTATLQLIDDPSVFGRAIERMKSRPKERSDYAQRLLSFSAHIALPFTRVTDNILRAGIRHTPGLGMLDRQNLADFKAGGARRDLALARQLVGATLIGYLVMKTDAGELTGDGPADFRLKAQMMASGWRPNSIKLADGKWHSLDGFDAVVPMANVIAQTVSHMKDKKLSKEDAASRMINLLSETGGNLAKNTFAKQAGDLFAMVGEGPKVQAARENYLANLSSSFMPAGLRQYAEMNDSKQRDRSADGSIYGKIEAGIKGSIPGLRETLPVKHDVYGREMESERTLTGVNKESTPTVDRVIQEVERLTVVQGKGALVGPATRANIPEDIRDGATSETVQAFQKLSGKYIYEDLKEFILSKDYEEMNDEERIDEIKAIVRDARADAKDELFPDLMETPPPSPQQEEEIQPWITGE